MQHTGVDDGSSEQSRDGDTVGDLLDQRTGRTKRRRSDVLAGVWKEIIDAASEPASTGVTEQDQP